jgi:Fe-S cluster assembly protein SufD
LEIFADDVKCSHGATSGQLDEEQMFYLQARGIGKEKARALLLHAFAGDIIQKIPFTSVADWLDRAIQCDYMIMNNVRIKNEYTS